MCFRRFEAVSWESSISSRGWKRFREVEFPRAGANMGRRKKRMSTGVATNNCDCLAIVAFVGIRFSTICGMISVFSVLTSPTTILLELFRTTCSCLSATRLVADFVVVNRVLLGEVEDIAVNSYSPSLGQK
ncbi:hypothetical protein I7I50_12328 [Histoplasma capsulatum G186AR]|uniref:Uncharacterized protein n=1 Tax=Ajellomyces capsulatus TaxID=5037 RepID=A0A8H8CS05_AJECA|nr:hypothetical protein I7I52_11360 [Histoplasma capsulatum]QSS70632.1 hypothetical protein I7I50_12328 [Histoplasma capsulatum G186AR]